jgi:hypothetical protein
MSDVKGTGAGSNVSETRVVDEARGLAVARLPARTPLPPPPPLRLRRCGLGDGECVVNLGVRSVDSAR